jgi:diguanylate cyclase (GGDEF)-like protein
MSHRSSDETPPQALQTNPEHPGSLPHDQPRDDQPRDDQPRDDQPRDRQLSKNDHEQRLAQQQVARLEALHALSLEVVAQREPDRVIAKALELAVGVLDAEASGYWSVTDQAYLLSDLHGHSDVPVGTQLPLGTGLTGQVVGSGHSILVDDYRHFEGRVPQFSDVWRSMLLAPVKRGEVTLGVLVISNNARPNAFSGADLAILERLATVCAISLENARLLETATRAENESRLRAEQREAVRTLSLEVMAQREPDTVIAGALEKVMALVGAQVGGFWRSHGLGQPIELLVTLGATNVSPGITMPWGSSAAGIVIASGAVLLIEDYQNWLQRNPDFSSELRSVMSIPIKREQEVLGAMIVARSGSLSDFDAADLELFEQFAAPVALALDNARLLEVSREAEFNSRRRADVSGAINTLSFELTAALEPKAMLERILQRATELIGGDLGGVFLHQGNEYLEVASRFGEGWVAQPRIGHGATGMAVQTGQSVLVEDYPNWDDRVIAPGLKWQSAISAPLRRADQVLGAITLADTRQKGRYSSLDLFGLERFAALASIALENARLHNAERRVANEERMRNRISSAVASLRSVREFGTALLEELALNFGYRFLSLYTLEHLNSGTLEGLADSGTPSTAGILHMQAQIGYKTPLREIPLEFGINGRVARSGKAVLTSADDPDFKVADVGMTSILCVPLRTGERVLGTLCIESNGEPDLHENDLELITSLAESVSFALENARLYELERRRARDERIRSSVSNALVRLRTVGELCHAVVNEVASSLAYTHVCVMQLETQDRKSGHLTPSERLRVRAQVGYRNLPESLPLNGSFSGQIARTQQAILVTDTFDQIEYQRFDMDLVMAIGVPLIGRDGVLGTLVVESAGTPKLTKTDLEMLMSLAAPISVALENAILHESLEGRARELEMLGREAHFAATHDTLTGLPNRRAFEVDANELLQQQDANHQPFCLVVIDLVGFKAVNDNFGHAAGDEALKLISQTLRILSSHQSRNSSLHSSSGDDVFAYRVGGDEFFLLIENNRVNAFKLVQQVISTVQGLEFGAGSELQVTPNIGLAEYPTDAPDLDNLLTLADTRMYAAKRAGKPVLEPDEFEHPPAPRRRKEDLEGQ